ncbi:MAG TPA: Asp23/Gls24 family envelope stress response protein [Fervidobacterium nodosum]|nr:Asp23/Gls24 family envelope stress response protein [Fervidobacterium nodosum]
MKFQTEYGEVEITVNALRKLTYLAVMETYGPISIGSDNWFSKWFSSEEGKIKVEEDEYGHINIDIFVEVEYGTKVTEVGRNIEKNVRHKLQYLANCENVDVNVHIIGVK